MNSMAVVLSAAPILGYGKGLRQSRSPDDDLGTRAALGKTIRTMRSARGALALAAAVPASAQGKLEARYE